MGTLFSALDIGRAGLQVSQVQLDVTGHNIASVNKDGFSRQRANLTTRLPNYRPYGALGRGPTVEDVTRLRDTFLDVGFREQVAGLGNTQIQAQYYTQIEDVFLEPSDSGLANQLNLFFNALSDFSNNVEDLPVRVALLSEGESIAASLNDFSDRLYDLRTNANEEVRNLAPEINSLSERIASLNVSIREIELSGNTANDLRDDRDVLLDELAEIVNLTYHEQDDGQVNVIVGGAELISGKNYRELETVVDNTIDPDRPDLLRVQFVDNGQEVVITDGELYGAIQIRDVELPTVEARIDSIASALIEEINSIHSQGNGLSFYDEAVRSSNAVPSPYAPLRDFSGLPYEVTDGSFDIIVYDSTGTQVESITVPIVASGSSGTWTTLTDIEQAIDAAGNLSALIGADGLLTITPDAGYSFGFANDSSNALTALGLHGFFTGSSAGDIAVNQQLLENPSFLSSGYSQDITETGANGAALAMASVRTLEMLESATQTIEEFYESTVVGVGIRSSANQSLLDVEEATVRDYDSRRQEVSGVNLDEEVTNLIMYQRAFEASSRVISVADQMLQTLISIVQ